VFTGARYARSGDVSIAYQVVGDGPIDLVLVLGWVSHLAYIWELPAIATFFERLASFSRLILFDKRGTGMSDRVHPLPTLEQRMDDVRAVLDAVGSARAALFGISEGGVMSTLFAATYPERTAALIINGSYPSRLLRPGYPWGIPEAQFEKRIAGVREIWGTGVGMEAYAPSQLSNPEVAAWWGTFTQMSASPGDAQDLLRMNNLIDIGSILPTIKVPTLVIHANQDKVAPIEAGRYFADHIPGARMLELDSIDHWAYFSDADLVIGEVQEFLTGARSIPLPETMLATVLCTNVAQAGAHAVWMGGRQWHDLVDRHHTVARRAITRYAGREIEAGEHGITAVFDGTARAIKCALEIRDQLLELGLRIRAGVHSGECEIAGGRPRGVALHVASSIMAAAQPGEVLVSSTVKDLVVGSGLEFAERGAREFAGLPGSWGLFAAGRDQPAAASVQLDPPPVIATLSRRENEVAQLLARGLSNREIAERLYLSERTVDNHVHHILAKLGFDSRVQIATWMARK
jgi:pimeloyl-ACP methyl ester carboxylesterase/DNA-binding CsgD family transcriptional regulator